jgi:hypothetical protein
MKKLKFILGLPVVILSLYSCDDSPLTIQPKVQVNNSIDSVELDSIMNEVKKMQEPEIIKNLERKSIGPIDIEVKESSHYGKYIYMIYQNEKYEAIIDVQIISIRTQEDLVSCIKNLEKCIEISGTGQEMHGEFFNVFDDGKIWIWKDGEYAIFNKKIANVLLNYLKTLNLK